MATETKQEPLEETLDERESSQVAQRLLELLETWISLGIKQKRSIDWAGINEAIQRVAGLNSKAAATAPPNQTGSHRGLTIYTNTSVDDTWPIVPAADSMQAAFLFIDLARAGLPNSVLREIISTLGLTVRELAPLLATTTRTLARRLEEKEEGSVSSFNKVESERLLLLQRLIAHGVAVFEDQGKFNRWLKRPLPVLQGQSPLQLLDTASGFQVVDELLGRIEYGVYS